MIARLPAFDITAESQSRDGREACEAYHCSPGAFCLRFEHSIT
jgi:hypothetical protein